MLEGSHRLRPWPPCEIFIDSVAPEKAYQLAQAGHDWLAVDAAAEPMEPVPDPQSVIMKNGDVWLNAVQISK